jgi:hypothetical protein
MKSLERKAVAGDLPGLRRTLLVLLAFGAVTAVMAGPMVNYSHLATAIGRGDARLVAWTMAWDTRALLHGLPLFESNVYYPAPNSLSYNEHLLGLSLFSVPIIALTGNSALAYNLLSLAAWFLNGFCAYRLARRFIDDDLAAFAGSVVYAFSSFRVLHAIAGHLAWAWTFFLPLSILAWDRYYRDPSWRNTAWAFVTVTMQALTSGYLVVMVAATSALWLACLAVFGISGERVAVVPAAGSRRGRLGPRLTWRHVWRLGLVLAAAAAVLVPLATKYGALEPPVRNEVVGFSASVARYLVPPFWTYPGTWLVRLSVIQPVGSTETLVFPGWIMTALAIAGAAGIGIPAWRRRWIGGFPASAALFFPLLAVAGFAISLGPSVSASMSAMPYDWLAKLPLLGNMRAPARFALLVLLAMSVLAAAGAAMIHRRFGSRARPVTALLVALALAESYPGGLAGKAKPRPAPIPEAYRRLAALPAGAVVSLPDYRGAWLSPDGLLGADYAYYSTAHWHPIVNGFGRSEPPDQYWIMGHMMAFAGPNSARTMRELGVKYVVLHAAVGPEGPAMLRDALGSPDFERIFHEDDIHLFRVLPEGQRGQDGAAGR